MKSPKAFISYSWTSTDHEERVLELATELTDAGVDIILDKWDLKEGNDTNVFMEKMVSDPEIKKVILVCDKMYCEKADRRTGGVGAEAQIISSELYQKVDQSKFVALVVEKDENGKPYLPIYFKSLLYIDLTPDTDYSKSFEQLLRWIYDKPFHKKPEMGERPAFLDEEKTISLKTTIVHKRLVDGIRNNNPNKYGILTEYFEIFSKNLESFRIKNPDGKPFDDLVIENINLFLPYRNEFTELIKLLCTYEIDSRILDIILHFFESLIPYLHRPKNVSSWSETDFDNFKFIIQELFLYLVAILLKYEKFDLVGKLISKRYYYPDHDYDRNTLQHFKIFRNYLQSLETRNNRLKLNRLSVQSDLLKERAASSGLDFKYLMQADFVLYIKSLFDLMKSKETFFWYPNTLLYMGHWPQVAEIFIRAESLEYFNKVKIIFGIEKKEDFEKIFSLIKEDYRLLPSWEATSFSPKIILNYENLCKHS